MFRMLGNKVELIRFTVTWADPEQEGQDRQENCTSEQHKDEVEQMLAAQGISFTTAEVNQNGNEWFDGLQFGSYDEALKAFNAGEAAYNNSSEIASMANIEQLRADIDYLSIVMGVDFQ